MQWLIKFKERVINDQHINKLELLKLIQIAELAEEHTKAMFPVKGLVKTSKQYLDGIAETANKLRVILEIDNVSKEQQPAQDPKPSKAD